MYNAPSEISDRKTFFSVVINDLKLFDFNQCICKRDDFNCIFEPKLDRNSPEPHPEAHGDFSRFLSVTGFLDVWRLMHPIDQQYTWCRFSNGHVSLARLDHWYITPCLKNVVASSNIFPSIFSDHHMVTVGLSCPQFHRISAYWKFNTSLLNDATFEEAFRNLWIALAETKPYFHSSNLWWDNLKTYIWLFCQQFNSYKTHTSRITLAQLETQILKLENKLAKQENETNYKLLLEKRTQL